MKWSREEIEYLVTHFPHRRTEEICRELGRTYSGVSQKARNIGLRKTAEFLSSESSGRTNLIEGGKKHRFQKGHKTWNKGKQFDSGGRSHETRFKKGNKPQTWKPVGTERVNRDGILERKISDTRSKRDWRPVHVLLWEKHNGPVPRGWIVVFKDKNRSKIKIENLECITRAENMKRNGTWNHPPEIAKTIHLRGVLNRQINKRLKHEKHDD